MLFLGLFCSETLNFNIFLYYEDLFKKKNEKLIKFYFKTKEKYGWPGHSKIYFNSGRELLIDRKVRLQIKKFFQLKRCLFCLDKLNRMADISFGDCYIAGQSSFNGKSSVIIRTKKGKDVFDKYSYLFTMENSSVERIWKSQRARGALKNIKDNFNHAKIFFIDKDTSKKIECNKIDNKSAKNLSMLLKDIDLGKKYKINRIRINIQWFIIRRMARYINKHGRKYNDVFRWMDDNSMGHYHCPYCLGGYCTGPAQFFHIGYIAQT